MTTLSYTVPVAGSTLNSIADPEIATALTAILAWANGSVDGGNVVASLTGRRLVAQASAFLGPGVGAGTYFIAQDGTLVGSGAATLKALHAWHLDPANFQVVGKSNTLLICRMTVIVANTPAQAITTELAAVTISTTSNSIVLNHASFPSGEASAGVSSPSNNSVSVGESSLGTFAFPAPGLYAPEVIIGGTTAAGSATSIMWQLFALNT